MGEILDKATAALPVKTVQAILDGFTGTSDSLEFVDAAMRGGGVWTAQFHLNIDATVALLLEGGDTSSIAKTLIIAGRLEAGTDGSVKELLVTSIEALPSDPMRRAYARWLDISRLPDVGTFDFSALAAKGLGPEVGTFDFSALAAKGLDVGKFDFSQFAKGLDVGKFDFSQFAKGLDVGKFDFSQFTKGLDIGTFDFSKFTKGLGPNVDTFDHGELMKGFYGSMPTPQEVLKGFYDSMPTPQEVMKGFYDSLSKPEGSGGAATNPQRRAKGPEEATEAPDDPDSTDKSDDWEGEGEPPREE
jgi:hypothetical protein